MHDKTIGLELLEQNPVLHEALRSSRVLLLTLDLCARILATRHQAWECQIGIAKPESDRRQVASEAMELAVEEIRNCFVSAVPEEGG